MTNESLSEHRSSPPEAGQVASDVNEQYTCSTTDVIHDEQQEGTCAVCLDALCRSPLGICLDINGSRSCSHYFHLSCLRQVEGRHCPICRVMFFKRQPLPSIKQDAVAWARLVSTSGTAVPSKQDVGLALDAMLSVPSSSRSSVTVTMLLESAAFDGHDILGSLKRLIQVIDPYLADPRPDIWQPPPAAEAIYEDGHRSSGALCKCGLIHVRRGDRVRRGPLILDQDRAFVSEGHLGTIARIGQGQEGVFVKWDRCLQMFKYTWPDPECHVLAPASYREVAEDIVEMQSETHMSSIALERLLRAQGGANPRRSKKAFRPILGNKTEDELREGIRLYHRVRIIPDAELVQEWFDCSPPCGCGKKNCTGGIRWTANAEKHLGREGYLLKIDEFDQSVLVCTTGPCTCQIWYPRLAVEPTYDPDIADLPSYEIGRTVECKMQDGWKKGRVTQVFWRGDMRTGPHPYEVLLDCGQAIIVPRADLIRTCR
jgi:hypothetical protein